MREWELSAKLWAAGSGAERAATGLFCGILSHFQENEYLESANSALEKGVVKVAHTRITQICECTHLGSKHEHSYFQSDGDA